jgi:hypothetical protein
MEKIKLSSIGELKPHSVFSDECLMSEPIPIPFFEDRKIKFIFDGCENDANFFSDVDKAISNFLEKNDLERMEISHLVFKNYTEFIEAVGDDKGLPKIQDEKDVWQFVYPDEIIVTRRHRLDNDIYLQIHCNCEWEIEHGLQIVFRQGKKITRVSSIDGHSTEADAYDKPDSDDELLSKF